MMNNNGCYGPDDEGYGPQDETARPGWGAYPGHREEFGGRGPRRGREDPRGRGDYRDREYGRGAYGGRGRPDRSRGEYGPRRDRDYGPGRGRGDFGGFASLFGAEGPFGPNGPFGPSGPFGANGPFGEDGPFGPRGPFGGPGRAGRVGPLGHFAQDERRSPRTHRGHRGGRARRGDVRLAILGLLAEENRNGYQLIRALDERTGGAWRPSPGAIYPALSQLEDEGLIAAVDGGGKVFTLTEAGRAEVAELGERARPWEGAAREATEEAERGMGGTAELWIALGQLGLATRAVGQAGDPDVTRAAVELLEESRRGLYRLLAEERDSGDDLGDELGDDLTDDEVQDTIRSDDADDLPTDDAHDLDEDVQDDRDVVEGEIIDDDTRGER